MASNELLPATDHEPGPSNPSSRPQPVQNTNRQFPPPPQYYKAFTNDAWGRHKASLTSVAGNEKQNGKGKGKECEMGADGDVIMGDSGEEKREVESTEAEMEFKQFVKPRADWIEKEGGWQAFGQTNYVKPFLPTAENWQVPDLRPPDITLTNKQFMHLLLRSFLHAKLALLDTLSKTLRPHWQVGPEGYQQTRHLEAIITNMMITANEAREAQAEQTLVLTMQAQLRKRREQTEALRAKCFQLATKLKALQAGALIISEGREKREMKSRKVQGVLEDGMNS